MSHTPGPYVFDAAFFESSKSLVTMKVVMEDKYKDDMMKK